MHQPKTDEKPDQQHRTRQIVYVSPPPEQIEKFAYAVCKQLGEKHGENYCDTETVRSFSSFLKTVVSIKVKTMNAEAAHVPDQARK